MLPTDPTNTTNTTHTTNTTNTTLGSRVGKVCSVGVLGTQRKIMMKTTLIFTECLSCGLQESTSLNEKGICKVCTGEIFEQ